jgi:hypothetical protein
VAKRKVDLGTERTRVVGCRHAALSQLAAGRIAKEPNASDARRFLDEVKPTTPVEAIRHRVAVELLDDLVRIDAQLKESHRRIREAIKVAKATIFIYQQPSAPGPPQSRRGFRRCQVAVDFRRGMGYLDPR